MTKRSMHGRPAREWNSEAERFQQERNAEGSFGTEFLKRTGCARECVANRLKEVCRRLRLIPVIG